MLGKYKVFDLVSEKIIFISDSIEEISIKLGVSTKTIYRDIDKLKKNNLL